MSSPNRFRFAASSFARSAARKAQLIEGIARKGAANTAPNQLQPDVVTNERDPFLAVLTKGTDRMSWRIGPSELTGHVVFHRSQPGSISQGALLTDEAVRGKRGEFEAEIASARATGWA